MKVTKFSVLMLGLFAALWLSACGEESSKQGIRSANSRTPVGTFFFFWHDCVANPRPNSRDYPFHFGPGNSCDQQILPYHPLAMSRPGLPYSSQNLNWYIQEFQQIKLAGINYIFPVYWGDHPILTFFNTKAISLMVQALDKTGLDLKIGMFDDTTSQVAQWNYDNGRKYSPSPAMNLADQTLWNYFYQKVNRFYSAIPRHYWATHNGLPVEQGGRPIIITWVAASDLDHPDGPAFFTLHDAAASLWADVKTKFKRDFGVEPFLILETTWYQSAPGLLENNVGDAQYSWGVAAFHSIWHDFRDYVVSSVGPGYDDRLLRKNQGRYRRRDLTHGIDGSESQTRDPLAFLRNEYLLHEHVDGWPNHGVRADSNLILVETWNELYEGTGISFMSDWPDMKTVQGKLPPDAYVKELRGLIRERPGYADYDATIVETTYDAANKNWTFRVRNDGEVTWQGNETRLVYRILDVAGNELFSGELGKLQSALAFGDQATWTFRQPAEWTDPQRFPRAAVHIEIQIGSTFLSQLGDTTLVRPVESVFPGFF